MREILLIDDDPIINFINSKVIRLVFPDISITVFENGVEALDHIRKNIEKPCLVFLDIHMPQMTGWDFIKIISEEKIGLHLQIHILTSSVDNIDLKKAEENELVLSYQLKPLKVDVLKNLNRQ